jgi:hypothetical protein
LNFELLLSPPKNFNAMLVFKLAIISFFIEAIVILWIADLLAEIQALRECSENRRKNKQKWEFISDEILVSYEVLYFGS